ncbi:MAG: hypothetical protein ACOC7J_01305 [Armatimonadota bacterium]
MELADQALSDAALAQDCGSHRNCLNRAYYADYEMFWELPTQETAWAVKAAEAMIRDAKTLLPKLAG